MLSPPGLSVRTAFAGVAFAGVAFGVAFGDFDIFLFFASGVAALGVEGLDFIAGLASFHFFSPTCFGF